MWPTPLHCWVWLEAGSSRYGFLKFRSEANLSLPPDRRGDKGNWWLGVHVILLRMPSLREARELLRALQTFGAVQVFGQRDFCSLNSFRGLCLSFFLTVKNFSNILVGTDPVSPSTSASLQYSTATCCLIHLFFSSQDSTCPIWTRKWRHK